MMLRELSLWICFLVIGVCVTYSKAFVYNSWLSGGFHMDDVVAVEKNMDVVGNVSWGDFFRHDFWGLDMFSGEWTHKSFRPLTTLSYRMNYLMCGGINTNGFHATNIMLDNLVTILVFFFCKVSLKIALIDSLVAAALFAVHPVHTESVLYLVGRADVLAAVFFLLGLTCYMQSHAVLSYLLGIMAGLSKELGFMMFPVLVLIDCLKGKPRLSTLLVTLFVLGLRFWYTDGTYLRMSPQDNPFAFEEDNMGRWLSFSVVHGEYFRLLLIPWFLCYDYSLNTIPLVCGWNDLRLLGVLGGYTGLFGLAKIVVHDSLKGDARMNRNTGKKSSLPSPERFDSNVILGGIFLATLIPSLNIFFYVGTVVGERLMYLPSIPVVIGIAKLLSTSRPGKLLRVGLFVCWFCRSLARVDDWKSAANLTMVDGGINPQSAKTMYNLAVQYFTKKNYDLAYVSFVASFETDEQRRDGIAYWRAGQVEILRGNLPNAESLLVAATTKYGAKLMVREEEIFHDAGLAIYHNGKAELGRAYLESALALNRRFPKALNNLGCLMANHGEPENGLALIQEASKLKMKSVIYWGNVWIVAEYLGHESIWRNAKSHVLGLQPSFVPNSKCVWEFKPAEGGPGNTAEND